VVELILDINECIENTAICSAIDANSTCNNVLGSYECICLDGFDKQGESLVCTDINECTSGTADCGDNSECFNYDGGYNCTCLSGYGSANGRNCLVDECTAHITCDSHATCFATVPVTGPPLFNCTCDSGYGGNGTICADINECNETEYCGDHSECFNFDGGVNCTCVTGYASASGKNCSDIDECAEGISNCHVNATCTNLPGTFGCKCNKGFSGDGLLCSVKAIGTGYYESTSDELDDQKGQAVGVYTLFGAGGLILFLIGILYWRKRSTGRQNAVRYIKANQILI